MNKNNKINKQKFLSDYLLISENNINKNTNEPFPSGYPCSFDTDCQSPGVCQFNVCTINIGGNEMSDLANICRGMSIKDCAKEMQKEREGTEIPIFTPDITSATACKRDKDCLRSEVCISGACLNKSNFPLIARQKRLTFSKKDDLKTFFEHKKTPLDGSLKPYEYMFLLESSNYPKNVENNNQVKMYDDYFYIK